MTMETDLDLPVDGETHIEDAEPHAPGDSLRESSQVCAIPVGNRPRGESATPKDTRRGSLAGEIVGWYVWFSFLVTRPIQAALHTNWKKAWKQREIIKQLARSALCLNVYTFYVGKEEGAGWASMKIIATLRDYGVKCIGGWWLTDSFCFGVHERWAYWAQRLMSAWQVPYWPAYDFHANKKTERDQARKTAQAQLFKSLKRQSKPHAPGNFQVCGSPSGKPTRHITQRRETARTSIEIPWRWIMKLSLTAMVIAVLLAFGGILLQSCAPTPQDLAQATQIVVQVQITQTAAEQQLSVKGTEAAVRVQATQDSNSVQATGTKAISEIAITTTQSVANAQLTQIPAIVQNQARTGNTNRTVGMIGLILIVLLGTGTGYFLVQLTRTKSMVAANGPTGPTMLIGNTIVPTGRMIGPATITPPGPLQIARYAALQLLGKNPAPLHDQVTADDKGATAQQLMLIATGDLAALAYAEAAEAGKIVIEKGALQDGSHLTIHQAAQLPQAAPQPAQLPMDVTVNQLETGGPQMEQVAAVLAQLGYKMPPLLPARGQVIDQAREE